MRTELSNGPFYLKRLAISMGRQKEGEEEILRRHWINATSRFDILKEDGGFSQESIHLLKPPAFLKVKSNNKGWKGNILMEDGFY